MKKYIKLTLNVPVLLMGFSLINLNLDTLNAQVNKTILQPDKTISPCKDPKEKVVTNIDQVKDFVIFNQKIPLKVKNKIVGYEMREGVSKGKRRSGGHCQFNSGWCGKFNDRTISVDNSGNILKSDFKMFTGTCNGAPYVRFEGLKDEDLR